METPGAGLVEFGVRTRAAKHTRRAVWGTLSHDPHFTEEEMVSGRLNHFLGILEATLPTLETSALSSFAARFLAPALHSRASRACGPCRPLGVGQCDPREPQRKVSKRWLEKTAEML